MSTNPDKPWRVIQRTEVKHMKRFDLLRAGLPSSKLFGAFLVFFGLTIWGIIALTRDYYDAYTKHTQSYTQWRIIMVFALTVTSIYALYKQGRDRLIYQKYFDLSIAGTSLLDTGSLWNYESTGSGGLQSVKIFPDSSLRVSDVKAVYLAFCDLAQVTRTDATVLLAEHMIPLTSQLNRLSRLGIIRKTYQNHSRHYYFPAEISEVALAQEFCKLKYRQLFQFVEPFFDADYARQNSIVERTAQILNQRALKKAEGVQAARDQEAARLASILEVAHSTNPQSFPDHIPVD